MKACKILIILLITSLTATAQLNKLGYPIIRNYTPEENGGEEQNWSIAQDKRGVMYFGNIDSKGILEYDGKTWRSIPNANNSYVRSLTCDDEGTIYVGAVGDFGYLAPDKQGQLKFISLNNLIKDSIKFSNVWKTFFYKDHVYFTSGQYFFKYDKKNVKVIDCGDQTNNYYLFSFCVNDHIYIGSFKYGLKELINDTATFAPNGKFFEKKSIYFMLPNGKEHAIVGTNNGFYKYNQATGETTPFVDKNNLISQLLDESIPYHAVVSNGGDYSFAFPQAEFCKVLDVNKDFSANEALSTETGLKDGSVTYIYRSSENTSDPIWLTHFYGISKAEIQSSIRRFGEESGLNGLIMDVIRYNNKLYVGTMTGLFVQTIENGFIKFAPTEITNTVWSFSIFNNPVNGKKTLLIGSDSGLYEVNESGKITSISNSFKDQITIFAYKVYQSKINPNKVYIGERAGITAVDFVDGKWRLYKEKRYFEKEIGFNIKSIAEDSKGNLWLGTYVNGLIRLSDSNTKMEVYGVESGLPTINEIQVINFDNTIYFGTNKGLYTFDYTNNKFLKTGLPDDPAFTFDYNVYKMIPAKNGFVLASQKNDSYSIEFAQKDSASGKYSIMDLPFKRLPNKFSDAVYNDNGIIWISCAKELYSYNPNVKRNYTLPYNALVRKVTTRNDSVLFFGNYFKVDDKNRNIVTEIQNPEQILKLPYRFNRLAFEYSATFYEKEEDTEFSYFLEGADDSWSLWNKEAKSTYTNLREGKYTFKVKARNIYGTESTIAEYKFSIAPPWYRTIVAWILYAILFIIVLWMFIRWNTRRLIAEKEELEKIVKERTAEVVAQKDEIEGQKEKISLQNEEIKSSIHYASRIQGAILTPNEQIDQIFDNYFILFLPRDIVSGDFYWVSKVGNKKICVVADCTGHGVPGGFMSMLGMSFINQIVNKGAWNHAGDILNQLRASIIHALHQTGEVGGSKDGMDIAIYVIDETTNTLEFSGANNPIIHIRGEVLEHIKGDKMPIGIHMRANEPFATTTIQLEPGDCIYTFSDGYADQFGGPDQRKFMIKNLKDLLLEIHKLPMDEQRDRLHKNLLDWHGDSPRIDDVVLMGVRI